MKNAGIIFKKEIKEIIRNKNIWLPILIITVIFSIALPPLESSLPSTSADGTNSRV